MTFRTGKHTKNPRETIINALRVISGSEWWSMDTGLQMGNGTTVLGWTGSVNRLVLSGSGVCSLAPGGIIFGGTNNPDGMAVVSNVLSGSREYTFIHVGSYGAQLIAGINSPFQYGPVGTRCGAYFDSVSRKLSDYWYNTTTDSEWQLTNVVAPAPIPAVYCFRASSNAPVPNNQKMQVNAVELAQTQPAETSNGTTVMDAGTLSIGYSYNIANRPCVMTGSDFIVCPKMMTQDQINVITMALRRIRNI